MNVKNEGYRWRAGRGVALGVGGALVLALSAAPAAARVNVFVGATIGIPLPVVPVYAAPPYYPPPRAAYYPPPPVYVDYGPRWKGKHYKQHWKRHYRSCHRCGGDCR